MLQWYKGHFTHEAEGLWPMHLKHSCWWKRRSLSKLDSHCAWGTNKVSGCKMDAKSTWFCTWYLMDRVFMVTWIIFKTHILEVSLTENQKTIAFWKSTTIGLLYFIMWEDPVWIGTHSNRIWLRASSHMTSHYTWGPMTKMQDFRSALGLPLNTSFGLSQFHGHGSWDICEMALRATLHMRLRAHD
jgi:hypothetical protein